MSVKTAERKNVMSAKQTKETLKDIDGVKLENSEVTLHVGHEKGACKEYWCTLHNRSPHPMRYMQQFWRSDRHIMERVCSHGVGHPDPDELIEKDWTHGCDGCCDVAMEYLRMNKRLDA
jgi:hypothetical protein